MKNTYFNILLFVIIISLHQTAYAQQRKLPPPVTQPFKHGENLKYEIRYGFIVGGEAELSTRQVLFDSQYVYHVVGKGKTTGITKKLFNVLDIYESYFHKETGLPLKAIRNIKENNYKYYDEVYFNHTDSSVRSSKSGYHKVPEKIFDMVSVFYYIRRIDYSKLKNGDIIFIQTYFDDRVFPFSIRYKGIEKIKSKVGDIMCHRFDPVVEPGRIFESEDDMKIWISKDKNLIPVLIQFDLIVGSVKCELIEAKNLKYQLEVIKE